MSIVHGSRGLIYFVNQFEPQFVEASVLQDETLLAGLTKINQEVKSLAAVIQSPEQKSLFRLTTADAKATIATSWRTHKGKGYCFVVGMTDHATQLELLVDVQNLGITNPIAKIEVLGESRTLEPRDGMIRDSLSGYGVRIYRWKLVSH